MSERIFLNQDQIKAKCHIGEKTRCCRYLGASAEGFECMITNDSIRAAIDQRVMYGTIVARSGPCNDPKDKTSEAKPWIDKENLNYN